jgi:CubicO group peptidase (beta-lactamase class C family)
MSTFTRRDALRMFSIGTTGTLLGFPQISKYLSVREQSSVYCSQIPADAQAAVESLISNGIAVFEFTPEDGWLIVTVDGVVQSNNIPSACKAKLDEFIKAGHKIISVGFPPQGSNSWVIITDKTYAASQVGTDVTQKLDELKQKGVKVRQIAFRPKRDNDRWIIVTDNGFIAQDIPDECYQALRNLQQSPEIGGQPKRKIHYVNFSNTGGWVILADDYFLERNLETGCKGKMVEFKGISQQVDMVAFSKTGWAVVSNKAIENEPNDLIRDFEKNVKGGGIWSRMNLSQIPGVSIAVVKDNKLAWSTAYGFLKTGGIHATHPDSIYQAGSMSQVLSTIGALQLVKLGKLGLHEDLRDKRFNFTLPIRSGFEIMKGQEPTLAMLLAHRGGFGLTGLKGYTNGYQLPKLDDIINGTGGANNPKIFMDYPADTRYEESAGGFILLDKLIESVTGQPAAEWLDENVLKPLEMKDSTFKIDLNKKYIDAENVAAGHNPNGGMLPGERYRFPESSAYGLFTNAIDMTNVVSMFNQGGTFNNKRILTTDLVETMLTPVNEKEKRTRGVGLMVTNFEDINENGTNFRYNASGICTGFRSIMFGFPLQKTGVIVMSNGNAKDGPKFCYDVATSAMNAMGME